MKEIKIEYKEIVWLTSDLHWVKALVKMNIGIKNNLKEILSYINIDSIIIITEEFNLLKFNIEL